MIHPRRFTLVRDHDPTGVTGTGHVADGVQWPDGTATVRWASDRASTVHWDRIEDAIAIHGHGGATRIVWTDEADPSTENTTLTVIDGPKMLRETFCTAQNAIAHSPYDDDRKQSHIDRLSRLIAECDRHRPLGANGKHGDLHTPTCGCEDVDAATIVAAVNAQHDRETGGYDPRTEVNAHWGDDREALIAAWEHDQQRRTKYAEHRVTLARQAEANKWARRLQEELEARDAELNNLAADLQHAERDNRRLTAEIAKLKR